MSIRDELEQFCKKAVRLGNETIDAIAGKTKEPESNLREILNAGFTTFFQESRETRKKMEATIMKSKNSAALVKAQNAAGKSVRTRDYYSVFYKASLTTMSQVHWPDSFAGTINEITTEMAIFRRFVERCLHIITLDELWTGDIDKFPAEEVVETQPTSGGIDPPSDLDDVLFEAPDIDDDMVR